MLVKTTGASARSRCIMFLSKFFEKYFLLAGSCHRRMVMATSGGYPGVGWLALLDTLSHNRTKRRVQFALRLHNRQHLAFGNDVIDADEDGFKPAGCGRCDRNFHFHGFNEYDVVAIANAAADLNGKRADASRHLGYNLDFWHSVLRGQPPRAL